MQCTAVRCAALRCDALLCDALRCEEIYQEGQIFLVDKWKINALRCNAMLCDAMRCEGSAGRVKSFWQINERLCHALRGKAERRDAVRCNAMRRKSNLGGELWKMVTLLI